MKKRARFEPRVRGVPPEARVRNIPTAATSFRSTPPEGKAHAVGQKQPNAWGLYGMHGNVWEYCVDFTEDYATMPDTDPVGLVTARRGAMRGGGWMHCFEKCRAATRLISDDMFGGAGFRITVNIH